MKREGSSYLAVFKSWCVPLVVLCGLVGPDSADARYYTVYSCRLPDGRAAPTSGWTLMNRVGVAQAADTCRSGGSMYVRFGPGVGAWRPRAWWVFAAPPDTRILGYLLYRHVRVHLMNQPGSSSEYRLFHGSPERDGNDGCTPFYCPRPGTPADPLSPANRVFGAPSADESELRRLILEFTCWRTDDVGGCPGYTIPGLYVYASAVVLADDVAPAVTSVAGINPRSPIGGRGILDVGAVDRGGGVRVASVELDGRKVVSANFDPNRGRCHVPFVYAQPCVLGGTKSLTWDTTRFSDGFHRITVVVRDAAGNASKPWSRSVLIDNGGNTCVYGTGQRMRAGLGRHRRRRVWPRAGRRILLRGRLRDSARRPIANGVVRLFVRVRGQGRFSFWTSLRTSASGTFRLSLPPGPSRKLRVSYCAPGGGKHVNLTLGVRATVRLRVNKRRTRNGRSVLFSGRLTSRPIPRSGKLVELQAYFRRSWRTFQALTTDRRGRFRFRYRFGGTSGRVTYRFRARVPTELGYPFERGKSRSVPVTVVGS
jgi:hypothetical protein